MQEDENLQVHDNHLKAFQLSQFAAQYLDHCVDKLESRIGEYSEQYQTLHGVMAELKHKNRSLVRFRVTKLNAGATADWLQSDNSIVSGNVCRENTKNSSCCLALTSVSDKRKAIQTT